jgi:hypothetical protein
MNALSLVGKAEKTVPIEAPAPRAPAVLEKRADVERELASLKLQIAETALAAFAGGSGGRDGLAALDAKIRACAFQLESTGLAHELALRLDLEAAAARRAAILALPPETLIAGITAKTCCKLCAGDLCVISGTDRCLHPRDSNIPAALTSDLRIRQVYNLAAEKLRAEKRRKERAEK